MTMNHIWDKLRKKNKEHYRQFKFCIAFAVMLISSYLSMLFSPIVQTSLPVGGDSRKQVYMVFGLAVTGCIIFIIYATGLFLRYKSREIGVFLALGTDKGKITRSLLVEIGKIVAGCVTVGILAGCALAFILGNIIKVIAGKATDAVFAFTGIGLATSLIYGALVFILAMILAIRFIRRSNIMDIINEQRKQEPLKRMVTPGYLFTGILFLVLGIVFGFAMPVIVTQLTQHWMGGWTNFFYIFALIGLYRVMVYSIACHRKGRHPQKYYNNVISYGMLKFQGGSIVRNMLVITLLITGGLFAMFYIPMNGVNGQALLEKYEDNYSYRYPTNADEVSKKEVEDLAEEYKVTIKNYREAEFIEVLGSGVERDNVDENGDLIVDYHEQFALYECIGVSEYNRITGQKVSLKDGTYYMIQVPDVKESVWYKFDNMDKLYFNDKNAGIPMKYEGNASYTSLIIGRGFDQESRFIISDSDFAKLKDGAAKSQCIKQVLFDTDDSEAEVLFSKALYKEYVLRQSEDMKVSAEYDAWVHQQKGKDYGYDFPAIFDAENSVKETDWQYVPNFLILQKVNVFFSHAVKFLLHIYVGIICLAAVGIISFTRSQSVGIGSRQIFSDVEKLGANQDYLRKLLKQQVQKVYILPTVIGSAAMVSFLIMIMWMNDGRLTPDEIRIFPFAMGITIVVILYQYGMYRYSLKKTAEILKL